MNEKAQQVILIIIMDVLPETESFIVSFMFFQGLAFSCGFKMKPKVLDLISIAVLKRFNLFWTFCNRCHKVFNRCCKFYRRCHKLFSKCQYFLGVKKFFVSNFNVYASLTILTKI